MKLPLNTALVVAALALSIPSPLAHAQDASTSASPAKKQATELEGAWEGTEAGGEAKGKVTLMVTGNSLELRGADKREWYKATFTLPEGTDPKQLRAVITESPVPEFEGKTGVSIYKIENGTLTLTGRKPGNSEVPKSFKDDSDTRTFIFKKAAAAKKE